MQRWPICADRDAIYLGAVGTPEVPPGVLERGLLLRMRFEFDLYVNLRPFTADEIDLVVVRENTEDLYVGEGGVLRKGTPHEVATQGSVNTRFGVERCVRFAFDLAAGAQPAADAGAQDQRPDLRRRPLEADRSTEVGRRLPRRQPSTTSTSTPAACTWSVAAGATT